ncbi:MAG: hypothetical protein MUC88_21245 [Planctomycetes bacterium]|jgi:uncharacterized protein YlaI|nr:hypothetical protein [Planctomycetota bacterium]
MEARASSNPRVGALTATCLLAVVLSAGCETSDTMAADPTNPMCPLCQHRLQTQTLAEQDYDKVVCPTCERVATVDPRFLEELDRFPGGPIGDPAYACAKCQALVAQCGTCRRLQARGP